MKSIASLQGLTQDAFHPKLIASGDLNWIYLFFKMDVISKNLNPCFRMLVRKKKGLVILKKFLINR